MSVQISRDSGRKSRYRKLWFWVVVVTTLVAVTPLVILTFVNYFQYQQALKHEVKNRVNRLTSLTKRSIEFFLEERRSTLTFITKERTYAELSDPEKLEDVYHHLKEVLGGIVDLGFIDSEGKQLAYIGPYDLTGKDYSNQDWFHEVKLRGHYVSDVFMGYRDFPHFVIAVAGGGKNGKSYVLRCTIDSNTLEQQIKSLNLVPPSEAFIINQKGVLQTPSMAYGNLLERAALRVPPYSDNWDIIDTRDEEGHHLIEGYAYIEHSPFILIIIKHLPSSMDSWFALRKSLWAILITSAVVIFIITMGSSYYMVSRIRVADRQRAQVLHNVEYTNKMASIGRLSAGVAHEINNPLAIINEKAGMMKDLMALSDDFPQKQKSLELVNSILSAVNRCVKITQRLLGFAKHIDVKVEKIDLEHLVREVLSFLEHEARYRNIELDMEVEDAVPAVESDRGQLQQVLLNIVNNSLNALSEANKEGNVKITVRSKNEKRVDIIISDNGPGISPEHIKHIFEPFYTTRDKGTGLGLSITYGIVSKLGGDINVDSTPGQGTSFTVTLPVRRSN
ncbi:MAG: ATP-binding protein [bacterium]